MRYFLDKYPALRALLLRSSDLSTPYFTIVIHNIWFLCSYKTCSSGNIIITTANVVYEGSNENDAGRPNGSNRLVENLKASANLSCFVHSGWNSSALLPAEYVFQVLCWTIFYQPGLVPNFRTWRRVNKAPKDLLPCRIRCSGALRPWQQKNHKLDRL